MNNFKIQRVTVIGCHAASLAIAENCLLAGMSTTIVRMTPGSVIEVRRRIEASLQEKRREGRLGREAEDDALGRLRCAGDIAATAGSDIVLDMTNLSVPSRQTLLRLCEQSTGNKRAILALSGSPLLVRPISSRLEKREKVVGMHFVSAAVVAGLCEVSPTDRTELTVLLTAMQFACALGKLPILLRGRWVRGLALRQSPAPKDFVAERVFPVVRAAG